jgi:DNA repair protein SbcC/Rad50
VIPLQLRVHNFLCYRDDVPPLSFEGIHLACLTGGNGHGKSALLDALTWAVWGKARAKHDDELIHQGQTEMEVEYTFELGGSVYRILRKRDSSRGGRTLLDLQVQHAAGFRSLAESTVRATQGVIVKLLRMDYDTFTNSAFLLQGKADAFTTRTPAERKQVLADILQLGRYDEYEERAKERGREVQRQVDLQDNRLKEIDRDLARKAEYEAARERAEARVAELTAAIHEVDSALRLLQREQQLLEQQQALLLQLERRLSQAERELGEIVAQIGTRRVRLEGYERALADRQQIEEGVAALGAARQAESAWNERLGQARQLETLQRDAEQAVASARHELELASGRLGERIHGLKLRCEEAPRLEHDLADARARQERLAERQRERDAAQGRIHTLELEAAGLETQNKQLRTEMKDLRERLDLLQAESGEAACPLCGQSLTDEHRRQLAAEYQDRGEAQRDLYKANEAHVSAIAGETAQLKQQVARWESELAGMGAAQGRLAQVEHQRQEARQAADELAPALAELAATEQRLQAGDYAGPEQETLTRLAEELKALGYNAEAHQQAHAEAVRLAPFEPRHQQLQLAGQQAESERDALRDLTTRRERGAEALAAEREQRASLANEVVALPGLKQQVQAKASELEEWQRQSQQARQDLGAARQQVAYVERMAEERTRCLAQRQALADEKAILEELRLAFGKKGIQAMVIEAAIPEIEYEANVLLRRMTEGRMSVRMETQRLTQKGDTQETLEITISDELGTRPYELFSGGETFRVNLAIRIALSKLLARRAGAQLQLLVIDEGFGTQDAEGRERLVEAITSIQEDFCRILVVTHVEELKDAFPVRIEVTKTELGSQFRLN